MWQQQQLGVRYVHRLEEEPRKMLDEPLQLKDDKAFAHIRLNK
jgi:hypothetical protein